MRVEAGTTTLAPTRPPAGLRGRRRRIDRFELAVLAAFAALSMWVLALDLVEVIFNGRLWTGTDGFYIVDQMQYLAWISSASHHLLASNMFVLRHTPADYFQPAVLISGVISAFGVPPSLSLLLWKPVAVIGMFLAVRAYARRTVAGLWPRRVVLMLGLFFGSFSVVYGSFGVVGDLFVPFQSWGYPFGLMAVAAIPAALLCYERARGGDRPIWLAGLLGGAAATLHPWQGELLLIIVIGTELWMWRSGARSSGRLMLLTLAMTGIPLAYYWILGQVDLSWALAREAGKHSFALWTIALGVLPLAIPAAFAYRRRAWTFIDVATRVWPLAALVIYVLSATELSATPLHAFDGITIPLAVLAVETVRRVDTRRIPHRRLLATLAVAVATIPATVYELNASRAIVAPNDGNANFITADERAALDYLVRTHKPGGVLTRFYLGAIIPAETGRATYVGHCLWSEPNCNRRSRLVQAALDGSMRPATARTFVLHTKARFVLSDCDLRVNLVTILGPIVRKVHRFGCASVYEIAAPRPATL